MRLTRFVIALTVLVGSACSNPALSPTPTPPATPTPTPLFFTINLPSSVQAAELRTTYPQGVRMSPIEAQTEWDYTTAYRAANVYYGPTAPPAGMYAWTGIVVAPLSVASRRTFDAVEWAGMPAGTYEWVGAFVFTEPRR